MVSQCLLALRIAVTDVNQRTRYGHELQSQIGEILLRNWDPLDVADEPACAGEHGAFVGQVYRLLASRASQCTIAQHPGRVEVESLRGARVAPAPSCCT